MDIRRAFARSLREIRLFREMAQEDFDETSRVYISKLERGVQSPTIGKIELLAQQLRVHPLTLLTLTYMKKTRRSDLKALQTLVAKELKVLEKRLLTSQRVTRKRK